MLTNKQKQPKTQLIRICSDLHKYVKIYSAKEGKTISGIVNGLIRDWARFQERASAGSNSQDNI